MKNCIVLSKREEDLLFIKKLNDMSDLKLQGNLDLPSLRDFLFDHPSSIVFVDGDDIQHPDELGEVLGEAIQPHRVFVIIDGPITNYPHLFKFPVFRHHMRRRYGDPASALYLRLMASTMVSDPFGLEYYFPKTTAPEHKKLSMTRSGQKNEILQEVVQFFETRGITGRLQELVEHAADELIMNGLFDAPVLPDGTRYRRLVNRDADFALTKKEVVEIELASCETYAGISVTDRFGSFHKELFMEVLKKNYQAEIYLPKDDDPGAGLGLTAILENGFSLLMVCRKGVRTEVSVFFPKTENFREYRGSFRFVSFNAD